MKKEILLQILGGKKKGQFVRISYTSDLDKSLRASARMLYKVEKDSVGTFKYGCDLRNVKRYQAKEAARVTPKKVVTEWNKWIVPSVLKENINTGRVYLSLITLPKNNNAKSAYWVTDRETGERRQVTREELRAMDIMQPSFFNKEPSETVLIPIENINTIY